MIALVCIEPTGASAASSVALRAASNAGHGLKVVVVSLGSAQQFRKSPRLHPTGPIERILRVQDGGLADANADTTGLVLAELARHIQASVVLVGEQSGTEGTGLVGAALAEHWQAPYVAGGHALGVDDAAAKLRVSVRAGGCLCEILAPPPVVIATPPLGSALEPSEDELPVPPVETLALGDLAIDPSRLVRRPDLRGTLISTPAQVVRNTTFEQAARALARR